MCSQHRRAITGVLVRDCPELMRWCHHCKRPHCLSEFANSKIGAFRKLATCERGRQVRRVNTAMKRAANGNPSAKGKLGSASPDDGATTTETETTTTTTTTMDLFPSPQTEEADLVNPGEWLLPEFTPVEFEISAPVHPSTVADTGQRPFDLVAQLVSEALRSGAEGEGEDAGVHDDNMSGSRSSSASRETLPGEDEDEDDAAVDPNLDLFSDPNLTLPSLEPMEETPDASRTPDLVPSSFIIDFILDTAGAAILPGSVRLHVRSCVPTPRGERETSAHLKVEALCEAVPREGVFGARAVTVSVMSGALLGHGWKMSSSSGPWGTAGSSASASASSSASDSRVVTFDAETRVSSVPLPMTPFPEWVRVPPVAVLGRPFHVRGLRGGETVHVFGQNMRPYSVVIPKDVGSGSLRVVTPALSDELGGIPIPGDHPTVPGFIQVQVLRPGQPAAGAEYVNVLLAEDEATALELDALRRGAGDGFGGRGRGALGVDDTCRELILDAGLGAPLAPIAGFVSESAFERFAGDFARMVELHWRSRLYYPAARDAARRVERLAARVFDRARAPAIFGSLEDIVDDVDAQEEAEAEAEAEDTRGGGGVFRLLRRIGDKLGAQQDKCTGSRGSNAKPGSARRVDAVYAGGFRWFFSPAPEDATAVESKETTVSYGKVYTVPTSTYIDDHRRASRLLVTLVILAVLKAPAWGIDPSETVLSYAFALALYWAPFEVGSRFDYTRAAIARLRERVIRAGLDGAYEALVLTVLQLSNGIVRTLIFRGTNPIFSAPDSRWIVVTALSMVNLTIYAIFTAESSTPSRFFKHFDVVVMGAASFAAIMLPCQVIAPDACARQGMFAPHGSVWSAAAWLFLLPLACATASRRAIRAANRSAGHPRAFTSKLKMAVESKETTVSDDKVYTVPTSTYIDAHRGVSTVYFIVAILGVLRAPAWGIKSSDVALIEAPALALYCAPFMVGSRFDATREAIARLRERVIRAGLDGAFEALIVAFFSLANGMDYGLMLRSANLPADSKLDPRAIIAVVCTTVNIIVYALFTAGAAPPSRTRADVVAVGAASFAAMMIGCRIVCPESTSTHGKGMFALYGSAWMTTVWLFLFPVACATAVPRAYRAAVRSVTRPKRE